MTNAADHITGSVKNLVTITADFSNIPTWKFALQVGKDGLSYYKVDFEIQMTCFSAYTKYELIYKGVNYGPVAAEYV